MGKTMPELRSTTENFTLARPTARRLSNMSPATGQILTEVVRPELLAELRGLNLSSQPSKMHYGRISDEFVSTGERHDIVLYTVAHSQLAVVVEPVVLVIAC